MHRDVVAFGPGAPAARPQARWGETPPPAPAGATVRAGRAWKRPRKVDPRYHGRHGWKGHCGAGGESKRVKKSPER